MLTKSDQLARVAARAAITRQSEESGPERLTDDYHDLLNSVVYYLEELGIELPDPDAPETQRAAWL